MVSLSQDSFYRELNETEIILANMGKFNFDHPDAFDTDLMESVLQVLVDVYHIYSPFISYLLSTIIKYFYVNTFHKTRFCNL